MVTEWSPDDDIVPAGAAEASKTGASNDLYPAGGVLYSLLKVIVNVSPMSNFYPFYICPWIVIEVKVFIVVDANEVAHDIFLAHSKPNKIRLI